VLGVSRTLVKILFQMPSISRALHHPFEKHEKQRQRTFVKWKTLDPEFNEVSGSPCWARQAAHPFLIRLVCDPKEFKFENIELNKLIKSVIEISVWDKDIGSNDFIGWLGLFESSLSGVASGPVVLRVGCVRLGQHSSGDELTHFFTMVKNPDIYHEHWHALKDEM
jgi:hypothetical protein